MALPVVSLTRYRRLTLAALVMVSVIIVTGAAVRLTGSGLGCPDWPTCDEGKLVSVDDTHQAIENINRLFTGVMIVALAVTVLASLRLRPRRRDLTWLSVGLVIGVFGQAIVGGIVVLTDLHPAAVMWHFLLSIVVVGAGMVLHRRAAEPGGPYRLAVPVPVRRHVIGIVMLLGVAIVTGTVVTGTGPHAGDETAKRWGFAIADVARIHGIAVVATIAATLWLVARIRRTAAGTRLEDALSTFLLLAFVQGGIGYLQYFTGVPALLVGFHILGATLVWIAAMHLLLRTREPVLSATESDEPSAAVETGASAAASTLPGSPAAP
jgi:cytochrome c oxidase assembly protein subunit 15